MNKQINLRDNTFYFILMLRMMVICVIIPFLILSKESICFFVYVCECLYDKVVVDLAVYRSKPREYGHVTFSLLFRPLLVLPRVLYPLYLCAFRGVRTVIPFTEGFAEHRVFNNIVLGEFYRRFETCEGCLYVKRDNRINYSSIFFSKEF